MARSSVNMITALVFYSFADPREVLGEMLDAPSFKQALIWLVSERLLVLKDPNNSNSDYVPSEKLKVWIEHLQNQPLPIEVKSWHIPTEKTL